MAKAAECIDDLDRLDHAKKLAAQLEAMLIVTTGEAGKGFRLLSELYQNNFHWACLDIASELVTVLDELEAHHD